MVYDMQRTGPLLEAIAKVVKPGDTVIDIGTGVGILAIAAAKAGAKKVWAIDCDAEALEVARACAKKAGVENKITFSKRLSFDLELDKRVDVILCETVGSFAFDENILMILLDAKKRLLKKNGRIVPSKLELWAAPIAKVPRLSLPAEIGSVRRENLLAKPLCMGRVDFSKKFSDRFHSCSKFKFRSNGIVSAFAVWPHIVWADGHTTQASPLKKITHWKQGILPVEKIDISAGESLSLEMIIEPASYDPKHMTERLWRLKK